MPRKISHGNRRGSILLTVILLLAGIGSAIVALLLYQTLALRVAQARGTVAQTTEAAYGVAATMRERVLARAYTRLGVLTSPDMDTLNLGVSSLPVPSGFTVDSSRTSFALVATTPGDFVPAAAGAVDAVPASQRTGWTVAPWLTGATTSQAARVAISATVAGPGGATETLADTVDVSQVAPWQQAITTNGTADIEASTGSAISITGTVRSLASVWTHGDGNILFGGDVVSQQGISVDGPGSALVTSPSGWISLASVTPDAMRTNPSGVLAAYGGRVRVAPSIGDGVWPEAFQSATSAANGECIDHAGACSNAGAYLPSLQIYYSGPGSSGSVAIACGASYSGSCPSTLTGVAYVPFPFTSAPGALTQTWTDPSTGLPWQGMFYDPRREPRCSAPTYRTFRCPTNPYGFKIDLSLLPVVPGGVLAIHAASPTSIGNSSGFQEVVLLTNASTLAGPLSIVSDLPVYISGNFNSTAPKPAMIDAPLITLLPSELSAQLATAQAWDSTGRNTPLLFTAESGVTVNAVLRSRYHVTTGTDYWGGTVEQIPSVAGDWSAVTVRVNGAIDGISIPVGAAGSYSSAFQPYSSPPTEFVTRQPAARIITYDQSLATVAGTPPGSWTPANLPANPYRSQAQQQWAAGQTLFMRLFGAARVQP